MDKKTARIKAHEVASSMLMGLRGTVDTFDAYSEDDRELLFDEMDKISISLQTIANKMKGI